MFFVLFLKISSDDSLRSLSKFHLDVELAFTLYQNQLVDMIQLVDSIRCILFANVEVKHVANVVACECKLRDSIIFYETQA